MKRPALSTLSTKAARVATDRAVRLTLEHGTVEALDHYAMMTPEEQRASWVILARRQAQAMTQAPLPSRGTRAEAPWWTPAELTLCSILRRAGVTSEWVMVGDKLHQGRHRSGGRAVADAWTWLEEATITAQGRPTDPELSAMLGRSVDAIRDRRRDMMRAAEARKAAAQAEEAERVPA